MEWLPPLDALALHRRLTREGELLSTWPATPFEATETHCYRLDGQYWIAQIGVGAVSFNSSAPRLSAFPSPDGDRDWFRDLIRRSWLPAIYPLWGRQVIHASAVAALDGGDAIALTGPTHAGKSTTAYGLGRRDGWRLLADDTVAFSPSSRWGGNDIQLHPLKNEVRLRPASAGYFAADASANGVIEWPEGTLRLRIMYLLDGDAESSSPVEFTRLRAAEGLPLLLQQAYALSFEIPTYNQKLMSDYARLAAFVPMFRLRFHRSFAAAADFFGMLSAHIAAHLELVAGRNRTQPQA